MGKSRLVRITNRGSFPRWRLESVGSTSKRGKMADTSQGGWFGSGTKIAPIAALALKMEVWISSTDSDGTYLVSYEIERRKRDGEDDSRVVRVYHEIAGPRREITEFSPEAFVNWSKPIGDDDKKEFRVWREYFRNAKDADPNAPIILDTLVQNAAQAPEGMTTVFLTRTKEYEEIMRHLNRYFKYLSKDAPVFAFPGIGQFWPKSQEGVTRMFSLGTLAFCHDCKRANWSTLFDYSFDNKELMSEERTFENMNKVYLELSRMLAAVPSSVLALSLLQGMIDGKAEMERIALGMVGPKFLILGKDCWKAAWHAKYGAEAVIASGTWADQHARVSFGKNPVVVDSHGLKTFLRLCGVQDSTDVIPSSDRLGVRVVIPTPPEKAVLDEAKAILHRRHPAMRDVPVHVFEPLNEETEKWARGFCQPPTPPYTEVYVRRAELSDIRKVLGTLNHEYRHVRTGAFDGTPEFMNRADEDEVEMLLDMHRQEEAGWVIEWEELKTDPDVQPPPLLPPPPPPRKK